MTNTTSFYPTMLGSSFWLLFLLISLKLNFRLGLYFDEINNCDITFVCFFFCMGLCLLHLFLYHIFVTVSISSVLVYLDDILFVIWVKVFRKGPYKSRPYHFKFFKGCLPQILLGLFLNTFTHIL